MTDTNLQNKARAVVLSALMVLSVMVGTIALSGGAAAAATSATLDSTEVQTGTPITVTGTDDADNMSDTDDQIRLYIDVNGNGTFDTGEASSAVADTSGETSSSSFEGTVSTSGLSTGDYDVYAVEGTLSDDTTGTLAGTVTVDGTLPVFGDEHTRDVTTTTPTLTVPLSDENTSVNASTIEVDLVNGEDVIHQVNAPSSSSDGISYDASAGEVTIDLSSEGLAALKNGVTYTASVSAEDAVGNSNSTSFTVNVDTGAPSFSFDQPTDAVVGSPTQTIEVSIVGNDINDSTAELTITGPGDYSYTNNSSHGVYDTESNTFTVNPGTSEGISALPNGSIQIDVTAADNHGNSHSAEYEFVVDNQKPIVDGVAVNESLATDENNVIAVGVNFNESVKPDSVEATITAGETTKPLTSFQHSSSSDKDDSYVYTTYDVTNDFNGVENGSVEVLVTAGMDSNNNDANLDAGNNSTTFGIDTVEPTVTIDEASLPGTLEGRMDIGQYVSVSQANGNDAQIGWQIGDGEVTWFDNAESVDTRLITEGNVDIVAMATDENGTSTRTEVPVNVDNFDVDVSAKANTLFDKVNSNQYPISGLLEVENNGTESVTAYGYTTVDDSTTISTLTWGDFTEAVNYTVDSDETYVFAARVMDGEVTKTLTTKRVSTKVFESDDLGIHVENVEDGDYDGEVNITVTSQHDLKKGVVSVESVDGYHDKYSETIVFDNAHEEKQVDDTYNYTFTHNVDRDGKFSFSVDSAKIVKWLALEEPEVSQELAVDEEKPELTDADIVGTVNGHTQVELTFDQPVSQPATSAIDFRGGAVSALDVQSTSSTGEYIVTLDKEIQTGDDANITIEKGGYVEAYSHDAESNLPEKADTMPVDSVGLDLQKGANFVSVPLEAGSVDLDKVDFCGCVDVVWAYDGQWKSYDPSADENTLEVLEGGQGYIMYANGDAEVDVRGYTVYNPNAGGDMPTSPAVENLDAGWNLIGHYQEGEQPITRALTTIDQNEEVGVIGPSSANASTMNPGAAYWVFVEDSEMYAQVTYDGAGESIMPSVSDVTVTQTSGDGDDTVTSGDTVKVSATVTDADGNLETVVVGASALGGSDDLTLTEEADTDTYSKEFTVSDGENTADDGDVELTVEAFDEDGLSATGSDSVTLDTTVEVSSVEATVSGSDITVTVTDDEELKTGSFTVATVDGQSAGSFSETGDTTDSTYTYEATISGISDGSYTVDVTTVEDMAGNTADASEDSAADVTVDNVQPAASWSGYSGGETISGSVDLTSQTTLTTDSTSTTTYEVDDSSGFSEITSPGSWDTSSVSGDVTLRVTVEDGQGNSDSATVSVTVDNAAPSTQSLSQGSDATTLTLTFDEGVYANNDGTGTLGTGDFTFTDSDSGGVSISSVDHTAGDSTLTITLSGSSTTSDSITIDSAYYDQAGNEANSGGGGNIQVAA